MMPGRLDNIEQSISIINTSHVIVQNLIVNVLWIMQKLISKFCVKNGKIIPPK